MGQVSVQSIFREPGLDDPGMSIRRVVVDAWAVITPIGLNQVHISEALTRGLVFTSVIDQADLQTLYQGFGYANLWLPQTKLRLMRGASEDVTFLRVIYVQQADVAIILAAREAYSWEHEEYGTL